MPRRLWRFPGGIRVAEHKELSTTTPVTAAPLPPRLTVPLHQHIGAAAQPVVKMGERVLKGQVIARAKAYVSAPIHAPTSGRLVEIGELPVPHPSGLSAAALVIEADGEDAWIEHQGITDHRAVDPTTLRTQIREAGIVGLGGAGFPSAIKLNPGTNRAIETLVLNGAECEPYITCDDMLMRTRAREVLAGLDVMRHILGARECVIGIEDNKPAAYRALREAADGAPEPVEVVQVPTRYPAGGEKQLIQVLTGKEVPSSGLPSHVGVVCHNVATAYAVHRAVHHGEPLISRLVTITGNAVTRPGNLEVRLGTPIGFLLQSRGVQLERLARLIMGGPMMGFALHNDAVPVVKTTNCVLAATASELSPPRPVLPCIRCGACAGACPVSLLPQQIYWHARARDFDKVQDYSLFDCIECGCCAAVCPSNIPLVQYYRFAKTEIWAQEQEKQRADLARRRHELRMQRQAREKRERAARLAQKKAAVAGQTPDDQKKAAIQAALERARAKRASSSVQPRNIDNLTDDQRRKIAEVDARRAAAKRAQPQLSDEQKAKVAAARARAAAKAQSRPGERSPAQRAKGEAAQARAATSQVPAQDATAPEDSE